MNRNELQKNIGGSLRFLLLITGITTSLFILSCNNAKEETAEPDPTFPKIEGSSLKTTTDSIDVKCFILTRKVLDDLYKSTIGRNNRKVLFTVYFDNILTPTTMKVLPYYARRHSQYGEGQKPIYVKDTLSTRIPASFLIGNSEFRLQQLLQNENGTDRKYEYLVFFPKVIKDTIDGIHHLVFEPTAYSALWNKLDDDFGDSNPTPPGRPGADN